MRRFVCAAAVAAYIASLSSNAAAAPAMTGNQLADFCGITIAPLANRERCLSYIVGAADGAAVGSTRASAYYDKDGDLKFDKSRKLFLPCTPDGVTALQVTDVVIKYLRENPAQRHLPAASLVVDALHHAFPCE
jgi:hypothetical protein